MPKREDAGERHVGAVERLWFDEGRASRAARTLLAPLEWLYASVTALRGAAYDRGVLRTHETAVPAVSIGNLSVGGSGKTPVAAWIAGELQRRGARPAIVLRGYGDDEPLVHARLNGGVPVVIAPDRVAGADEARRRGADVVVLDDAFQHRRARRVADVVLLSADGWAARRRLLPRGPWRESLAALRRASLVVVTRKAASPERAREVLDAIGAEHPALPAALVHLAPGALVSATESGREQPLAALAGAHVHAIAAIGEPRPFLRQLEQLGAHVDASIFPDHHPFTAPEAALLAGRTGADALAVCTLKDAVKLAPLWPRGLPLWYLSQRVLLERGAEAVENELDRLLHARASIPPTAG